MEVIGTEEKTGKKKIRKVALVGSASSSLKHVPWDDLSVEIWGLGWRSMKRCERYFEMHTLDLSKRGNLPPDYHNYLANLKKPIYLQDVHPAIPNGLRYPLEEVTRAIGKEIDPYADGDYFASSIGYMLALAIYENVDEIQIYGIDLLCDDEYGYQRPNAEYLIGLARGKGIRVFIPEESALCKFDHRYGYEEPPNLGVLTHKILEERLKSYEKKHENSLAMAYLADGAAQEVKQLLALLKNSGRGAYIPGSGGNKD